MLPAPDDPGSLRRGRFTYLPVVPGRLEFAIEVRRAILRERPGVVAVELPSALETHYRRAIERLPEMSVLLYADPHDEEGNIYVPVEPCDPFSEAVRTAQEVGSEVLFIEPSLGDRPHLRDVFPDTYAIHRIGLTKYIEAYRVYPQPRTEETAGYAAGMAWKLQGTDPEAQVLIVVSLNLLDPLLDAMEEPQEQPAEWFQFRGIQLVNPHPECLAEITVEFPFLQERWERARWNPAAALDRRHVQLALLREAEVAYEANAGERVAHWQRRLMARYGRNLASMNGELVAGLFDLTVAARSIVDDNYAWEVWDRANQYFWQRETAIPQTVKLSGEEVWLDTRRIRLRRRLPRPKQRTRPRSLKPRKKEALPGQWASQLDGDAICSYPPEDIVIEDYGRFLRQKAKSMVTEERVRTEPFVASLLDGIDLRETIRNWHTGNVYVREFQRLAGEVGSVVIIFDEDREQRYSYCTTWQGEHQNESDMAFYSTHPFEKLVGPGIGRAEYGGLLMSLPPHRMYDVWGDPDYDLAETKAERLLLAALDYSLERHVVYVAPRPPRSVFRSVAAHLRRSILFVPIGVLSPTKIKKLRVVHVLDGHARRQIAKDYIW